MAYSGKVSNKDCPACAFYEYKGGEASPHRCQTRSSKSFIAKYDGLSINIGGEPITGDEAMAITLNNAGAACAAFQARSAEGDAPAAKAESGKPGFLKGLFGKR